ncbi:MAG TPA: hypothetical protein VHY83_10020 [Solirubrobacteraceae bacterium]|nr:hypothetical protein [Solirubrobacteraceae bacterium]
MTLDANIRAALATGELQDLFLDELGWDQPALAAFDVYVDDASFHVVPIAQKRGLHVFELPCDVLPSDDLQSRLDREVSPRAPERLLVFRDATREVWRWPEPRRSGGARLVAHRSSGAASNEALVQRLAGVRFVIGEEEMLTLPAVKDRVRTQFRAEQVTARFYTRFADHHERLQIGLDGIPEPDLRSWYASLLMNRLIFIYFFQKKGFLNGDRDYLRTCLTKVRSLQGPDRFYDFYRDALLPMFHQGFGSYKHEYSDSAIGEVLGAIPYVNGGIFEEHELETAYTIEIADEEFEQIFDFFDEFTWHLDERPHGDPNAINPDVIGYIFERYINLTSTGKKKDGAYYTKEDVTGYMAAAAVIPRIFDRLRSACDVDPFPALQAQPRRYIPEALRHGEDAGGGWLVAPASILEAWSEPRRWGEFNATPADPASQLPGESWIETLDRRRHVDDLEAGLKTGRYVAIDDVITTNVDLRTLLGDVLHELDTPETIVAAWTEITSTTVIDPTCGSGAFLFAVLDILDDVYAALLERARTCLDANWPNAELVAPLVAPADAAPNDAYYRRKHAALNNLFGLDIMPEAVETAKLRLFLALVSTLERREEIEPLPDLDYNLRAGNLLVGFFDAQDARERVATSSLDALTAVDNFLERAETLAALHHDFVAAQTAGEPAQSLTAKKVLSAEVDEVRLSADEAYAAAQGVPDTATGYSKWFLATQPFHWFLEFPQITSAGGFDVVIGNPPYVSRKDVGYAFDGFRTSGLSDICAPCVERALSLLHSDGRFAMILPIAFQFSDRYKLAREVALGRGATWWGTYSRNPSALFTAGLGVRNCIVIVGPKGEELYTTETRRWQAAARESLFGTQRYSRLDRKARQAAWLPRTGDEDVAALLLALRDRSQVLGGAVVRSSDYPMGYKATALYYVPVYLRVPPVYDGDGELIAPPKDGAMYFQSLEDALIAYAMLAGELSTLWWMSTGDDFDVTAGGLKSFPVSIGSIDGIREPLIEKARELNQRACDPEVLLFTPYAGLMTGSWDLRLLRDVTREIDLMVLKALELERFWPAVLRANARFLKSTGERPGTERGTGWIKARWPAAEGQPTA